MTVGTTSVYLHFSDKMADRTSTKVGRWLLLGCPYISIDFGGEWSNLKVTESAQVSIC